MVAQILGWTATVIAILMITFTVLPIFPTTLWWIRDMGFPRVQILVLLLASALPLLIWFRADDLKFAVGIVGALCILYQFYEIFPYTMIAPEQSKVAESTDSTRRIRLMVANVLQSNRKSQNLIRIVKEYDPDILVAVETDRWWTTELSDGLRDRYPFVVSEPIDNTYGIILFSRLELIGPEVRYLVIDTIPSILTDVRLRNGETFRLYSVHPLPPLPGMDTDERDAELLIAARMVKKRNEPAIVLGDLNDVAWSATTTEFQEISSMLDPRKGRGMFNTFHAEHFWLRYPLDHIFHTKHFRLVSMDRLPAWGSDHFPIGAEFSYEPENQHGQDAPEADGDDHRDAEEKIEEGMEEGKKVEKEDVEP